MGVGGWDSCFSKAPAPSTGTQRACAPQHSPASPLQLGRMQSLAGAMLQLPLLSLILTNCLWARQCLGILGLGTKMCPSVHHPHLGNCVHP